MAYTTINKSTDHFNTVTYTGNSTAKNIQGVGFKPDWVWIKNRTTTDSHVLFDAVRTATKRLSTPSTDAQQTQSSELTAFLADGFSIGTGDNVNRGPSDNFVSWNWKANGAGSSNSDGSITSTVSANSAAGVSIVKWTGNATSGATVGHGLGAAPKVIITKRIDGGTNNWVVGHGEIGFTKRIYINSGAAAATDSGSWNNTAPSSTYFTVGSNNESNGSGYEFISYCFVEKTGFSSFGYYKSNGSTDGPFVFTNGVKPKFLFIKNSDDSSEWEIYDSKRIGYNDANYHLNAHNNAVEATLSGRVSLLSNGFKIKVTNSGPVNSGTSGRNYIYLCFGQSLVGSNQVPSTGN